jgi:hypothetical protein
MPLLTTQSAKGYGFSNLVAAPSVPGDYYSLASTSITSNTNTYTFNSIPTGYKHLELRMSFFETSDGDVRFTYNGDETATNYTVHEIKGNGTSATPFDSNNLVSNEQMYNYPAPETYPVSAVVLFADYLSTSKNKVQRVFMGIDTAGNGQRVGYESQMWKNTSAITSIKIFANGSSKFFFPGSTFSLYGVK